MAAQTKRVLRVCTLYPDLLNIYADRGNLMVLQRRCEWRGIDFEVTDVGLKEGLDPSAHDFFYLGGGQDREQELCAIDLVNFKRDALHQAAQQGAVFLAVCGGYQLLGNYYQPNGKRLEGLELVDLHTINQGEKRLTGNVAIEAALEDNGNSTNNNKSRRLRKRILAGFENHGGRTYLGDNERPLGRVLRGHGNNGGDGHEGVVGGPHSNIIGTYLHGPLLPKNSWFADWLIAKALRITPGELAELDDRLEVRAHRAACRISGVA